MRIRVALVITCALGAKAAAQPAAPRPPAADSGCTYTTCGLSIAPTWDGLAVRRGIRGPRVANLHFFWPRDVSLELRGRDTSAVGADSAAAYARRAVALRQAGAGFTDIGALTIGVAVIRALAAGRSSTRDQVVAAAGLGALAISVPIHFAADGELSRAVWWHNLRFAHAPTAAGGTTLGTSHGVQARDSSLLSR
jgi:hypothetical protein